MTENLSHSLLAARKHGMHFAQENPTGGLSRGPFMHNPDWLQHTHCLTGDYCAYDHPVKKPTNPPLGVEVQPTNAKESQVNITRPSMREKYIRCIRYKT